jgi:hypothetical protein
VEDARYFLQLIRENGWRSPKRDLRTFEIVGQTPKLALLAEDNDDGFNLSSIIFWFSLQNMINFFILRGQWKNRNHYFPFQYRGTDGDKESDHLHVFEIMDAHILLINEPGKGRKLVKSHPLLNWMLIPASKMCQKILAQHPDHRAGLELGAHDWVHSKRISGDSEEAQFMYNELTGKIKPEVQFGYTDWTEATDRMSKRRGIAHLTGLFEYIGFPKEYAKLIILVIREPQPVKEVVRRTVLDDLIEEDCYIWKDSIREGFMMGNQMTKTLLHLCHVSERAFVELFLKREGVKVHRSGDFLVRKMKRIKTVPYTIEENLGKVRPFPLYGSNP